MTKKEEIIEKLKFYQKCLMAIPDRLKTIEYEINALKSKQVLLKKRRDKKVNELDIRRNDILKEKSDLEATIASLYKELNELKDNSKA